MDSKKWDKYYKKEDQNTLEEYKKKTLMVDLIFVNFHMFKQNKDFHRIYIQILQRMQIKQYTNGISLFRLKPNLEIIYQKYQMKMEENR